MHYLILEVDPDQETDFVVDKVPQGSRVVDQQPTLVGMVGKVFFETGGTAVDDAPARTAHQPNFLGEAEK